MDPVFLVSLGFVLGIYLLDLTSLLVVGLVFFLFINIPHGRLFAIFLLLGAFWFLVRYPVSSGLEFLDGEKVMIEGWVKESDQKDGYRAYELQAEQIVVEEKEGMIDEKILVRAEPYPIFEYGDRARFEGKIQIPEVFDDFDYPKYLERKGIFVILSNAKGGFLGDGEGNSVISGLLQLRGMSEDKINQIFPEPSSSLLAGLLLGVRRGFSDEFQRALQITGTTHIIAISGYNISILILLMDVLLSRLLPRKKKLWIFGVGITLFVVFVGGSPSVVRAGFMGWFLLLSSHFGRKARPLNSLLFAGCVMVFVDPMSAFDIGFALSFLATFGIIALYPMMKEIGVFKKGLEISKELRQGKKSTFSHKVLGAILLYLIETFLVTLSAQVFVLPLLISIFGSFSVISIVVNLLVLFPIPFIMAGGAISVFLFLISPWLSFIPAFFVYAGLAYMIWIIEWFDRLGILYFEGIEVNLWWFVLIYGAVGVYVNYQLRIKNEKCRKLD